MDFKNTYLLLNFLIVFFSKQFFKNVKYKDKKCFHKRYFLPLSEM